MYAIKTENKSSFLSKFSWKIIIVVGGNNFVLPRFFEILGM